MAAYDVVERHRIRIAARAALSAISEREGVF
jgi:hypothetical protein